jgi:hypothetical protein
MVFASLAAAMTLGHLVGPYGHAHLQGHEHATVLEIAPERCDTELDAGEGNDHNEASCGPVLTAAAVAMEPDAEQIVALLEADHSEIRSPTGDLGPNGRGPPVRSQLQVVRV